MFNRHRHGVSRLSFYDALYQAAFIGSTILWAFLLLPLWERQLPNAAPGHFVIVIVALTAIMLHGACTAYSVLIAERGASWPQSYLTGYGLVLLSALLLSAWKVQYGLLWCLLVAIAAAGVRRWISFHQPLWLGEAGKFLRPVGWVKRFYRSQVEPEQPTLQWLGIDIPFGEGTRNFSLMGAISSGKSILLRLFLQSFVPLIGKRKNLRLLVFDPTFDMVSIIRGMNPTCPIHILSPRDARASVWDITADVRGLSDARALATTLTPPKPDRPGPNDFWIEAAQYILEGLALYFSVVVKENWEFRDLLIACNSQERLMVILNSHPATKEYVYALSGDRLTHSIMVTVQVYLSQFSSIASAWYHLRQHAEQNHRPLRTFSFANWVHEDGVTILGRDLENRTAMMALNRLFITKAGRVLLNQFGDTLQRDPHTFIVLDEAHTLGVLPEWEEFTTNASSRGVSIATAMQALPSLQRLYGKDGAEAILGQFFHKAFLRLNDTTTAEYASSLVGRGDRFQTYFDGKAWKISERVERNVAIVAPEELRRIPPPAKGKPGFFNRMLGRGGTPLKGFYLGIHGCWSQLSPRYISENLKPKANVPNRVPWEIPPLPTWDYSDIKRLKLDHVISPAEFQQHLSEEIKTQEDIVQQVDDILDKLKQSDGLLSSTETASEDEEPEVSEDAIP
ncbi:MAG: type IV secretion system DNA-binding domain-containing protein [Cyanobacteria bacterium J06638_22]